MCECPQVHRISRSDKNPGRGMETNTFAQFLQNVTISTA